MSTLPHSVILPHKFADQKDIRSPLFCVAGPRLGAGEWEYEAYKMIAGQLPDCTVAICRSYPDDHPLMRLRLPGFGEHARQRLPWELHHAEESAIRYAAKGCLLIYVPRESETEPRCDGIPYATNSRFLIGKWLGRMMYDSRIRCVIGVDPKVPGYDEISNNFKEASGAFKIKLHETLKETVKAAVKKALGE